MLESIIQTLKIMGLLGIVFFILVLVNTVCGILFNTSNGEEFSKEKLFKGLLKAFIFYMSSVATSIAFSLLPFINNLVNKTFDTELLSPNLLNSLSSIAVLAIVVAAISIQGKKALEGIKSLSDVSISADKDDEEEDLEDGLD